MDDFTHIIRPGTIAVYQDRRVSIFCKVEYTGGRLSITGVEGPFSNGDCAGSCGQIEMGLSEPGGLDTFEPAEGWTLETMRRFLAVWDEWHLNDMRAYDAEMKAAGWRELAAKPMLGYEFSRTRESYEAAKAAETAALDALKAGVSFHPNSEQVEAASRPYSYKVWLAEGEPEPAPRAGFERARHIGGHNSGGVKAAERKTLGWLKPSEHAEGLLTRKLRDDGPGYGSAWYSEEVPADVLEWLKALPAADRAPAWV